MNERVLKASARVLGVILCAALLCQAAAHAQKSADTASPAQKTAAQAYACPMHPEVTSDSDGRVCPKCNMKLVRASSATSEAEAERRRTAEASAKYFPNHTLVTQDGERVRFYDDVLKGRVVLINFIFTTCTGVCSPMTANLAKVQSYLGERVGRDVRMISITVDPLTDTPTALRAYADKHKAGPGWYFLTGAKENVDWVLYKLGGYVEDKSAHSGVLIIGNEATGQWMKVPAMSKPTEIAAAVLKLAGDKATTQ